MLEGLPDSQRWLSQVPAAQGPGQQVELCRAGARPPTVVWSHSLTPVTSGRTH